MKKILTVACVASLALASLSSCCGKGGCSTDANEEGPSKAVIDSISVAQGEYIGQSVLSNYPMMSRMEGVTKEDIIKGIQLVFGADAGAGTKIGIQFGLQMLNEIQQLDELGIKVDRSLMLNNFKKAFLQDSVDQVQAQHAFAAYQGLVNKVQEENRLREEARKASSEEAKANVANGEAYISSAMAADPAFKTTPSGLVYKIETQGEGKSAAEADRMKLRYVEHKIDGSEIVKTNDTGRTTYVSTLNAGFAEGLKMLNEGGKAVFIVPAQIAYGVNGIPSRNVGPNETIVYEVEVLSVD